VRILVTNDDGIGAPGIAALARFAVRLGEVTVIAPRSEQSGKSHSIDLVSPFEIKKVPFPAVPEVFEAYSVASTPADCVRYGVLALGGEFDLVLSGINRGFNLGVDIVYSGTVGAAFEAAYFGIRSLALSTDWLAFGDSTREPVSLATLERIWDYVTANDLFAHDSIYNINIPMDPGTILPTRQGGPYYRDVFNDLGDGTFKPHGVCVFKNGHDLEVDADAVTDGYISVTPLTIDRTDRKTLEVLRSAGK